MGPLPSSEGNTHILVVVDYVSKWVEAIPTKSADGETSLRMLLDITSKFARALRRIDFGPNLQHSTEPTP
jgi:hypothetical protein